MVTIDGTIFGSRPLAMSYMDKARRVLQHGTAVKIFGGQA
jgi:hypothetical protein